MEVFVTSRAEKIVSLRTTSTPFAARRGGGGRQHGLEHVQVAVRAQRRRRPHRADQHHRLLRLQRQVQEVRGLLERVRPVGDHDAVGVVGLERLVDEIDELEPVGIGERVARQLPERDLDDVRELLELR